MTTPAIVLILFGLFAIGTVLYDRFGYLVFKKKNNFREK